MTHKEKAIELLSQMPEPYRTFALKSLKEFPIELTQEPESISDVIVNLKWSGKYETLGRIWAHYAYGSSLPELPLEYRYEQLVKENDELKRKVAELESKLKTQFK